MNKVQSERMDPAFKSGVALVKELEAAASQASRLEAQNAEQSMRRASQINIAIGVAVCVDSDRFGFRRRHYDRQADEGIGASFGIESQKVILPSMCPALTAWMRSVRSPRRLP